MDLVLVGVNPNALIIAKDQQEYYENYYTTGDADYGITNVHTYKTITYTNIYPNIDLVLHAGGQTSEVLKTSDVFKAAPKYGMEYSFIVHPGANVADIQMQWTGLDGLKEL